MFKINQTYPRRKLAPNIMAHVEENQNRKIGIKIAGSFQNFLHLIKNKLLWNL